MRILFITVAALLFFMPCHLYADSDSELRAEIIGEQGGKAIAVDHNEYQPEKAKKECKELFHKQWEEHFKEMGFDTDEATVNSFVAGCIKSYNKKFGE